MTSLAEQRTPHRRRRFRGRDPGERHRTATPLVLSVVIPVAIFLLAGTGTDMTICLLVLMLAPIVTILGYETVGHRHMAAALERL